MIIRQHDEEFKSAYRLIPLCVNQTVSITCDAIEGYRLRQMIKRCPTCNRTYSDETISFCLADGSLLSAPLESERTEAPPTEILPPPTRAAATPTQPARTPLSTITSLPEVHSAILVNETEPKGSNKGVIWGMIVVAIALLVGIGFMVRYALRDQDEPVPATLTADPSLNNTSSPRTSPANSPEKKSADLGFADPNRSDQAASNSANTSANVFSSGDVDQKVRILAKPEPAYTEEARKDQISGTVILRAVFSSSGEVTNIHAVSGLPGGLTERAIAAAKQIKFVPATKDGRPVSMWMQLEYNFNPY